MKQRFIAVEGNIGAGKTTLARALAADLNANLLLEEFEENKALQKFYEHSAATSRDSYALATELQFLIDRFLQLQQFFDQHSFIVSDYMPEKSRIFAKMNLSQANYELFSQAFQMLLSNSPRPDCIIFLESDTTMLKTNIAQRARTYEQTIQEAYLARLKREYAAYLMENKDKTPIIYVSSNQDINVTLEYIKNELYKIF
jgi:deoxyguanosine kinase